MTTISELSELSLISSGVQDTVTFLTNLAVIISIIVSIGVLAYQIRLQRKDTEYSTYEKLMSDFSAPR